MKGTAPHSHPSNVWRSTDPHPPSKRRWAPDSPHTLGSLVPSAPKGPSSPQDPVSAILWLPSQLGQRVPPLSLMLWGRWSPRAAGVPGPPHPSRWSGSPALTSRFPHSSGVGSLSAVTDADSPRPQAPLMSRGLGSPLPSLPGAG